MQKSDPHQEIVAEGSLKKKAARGAVWITIEVVSIQAVSFLVFAVLAHFIEPKDFGLLSISFLAIQSLQILMLYNVVVVATRKENPLDLDYTTTFWVTLGLSVIAYLIICGVSPWIEILFHAPGLTPVLRTMSVILLFMGLTRTHEAWMMRHFHFKSLAFRGAGGAVVGGVVGVVLAINGFGVYALVVQQITASAISLVLLWASCPWKPNFKFSIPIAKEILAYLRAIFPAALTNTVTQNCDISLVAYWFGPTGAGIYSVAKRVRLTLQLVTGDPIRGIAMPTLAAIQGDPERMRWGVAHSLTLICVICCPVFWGASAVAPEAISVLFGPKWGGAVPVLELLSFSGFALVLLAYVDTIYALNKKPIYSLYVAFSYLVLTVIAVFICAKLHIASLALPFVLPYLVVLPLAAFLVTTQIALSLRAWIGAVFPGAGAATLMYGVVCVVGRYLPFSNDLLRLVVLCLAGAFSYSLAMWILWRNQAEMVIDTLNHMRHR